MSEKIVIKHVMDEKERELTLNEAFLEALSLSESRANETEEKENDLHQLLKKHPTLIDGISDDYKLNVLKGWDYEILNSFELQESKILVRVDLFGERESVDMWEGYIFGMTVEEFSLLRSQFVHDFNNDIFANWFTFLDENNVRYEPATFDINEFN